MLAFAEEFGTGGCLRSTARALEPTEKGEQLGLRVQRAHRFWERYLSDDAQEPLEPLQDLAERAEHRLTADQIEALSEHLGHPRTDPHGEVIPTASGEVAEQERTPLIDWPCERPAVIVHVEDEPGAGLIQALAAGLHPGTVLRVLARDAAKITVDTGAGPRAAPATLADLPIGRDFILFGEPDCTAVVVGLVVAGVATTLIISWTLSRTVPRGEPSAFILELPPYRRPNVLRILYASLIDRTFVVLMRAAIVAAPAGVIAGPSG